MKTIPKKINKKNINNVNAHVKSEAKTLDTKYNRPAIIILFLYILTELVPQFDSVDVIGSHWLYLSVLNIFTTLYLFRNNAFFPSSLFKTAIFTLYSGFIIVAGLSFIVSYNIIESLVTYSRLVITFIAFLNIFSLIYKDKRVLNPLFFLLALLVVFNSMEVIYYFFSNYDSIPDLAKLINNIKGNAGNKNILAAGIAIKIPFLIYAIHNSNSFKRILFFAGLLLSFVALFIVNARSSFISLFLEIFIYLILITLLFFKNGKQLRFFKVPGIVIGILIISLLIIEVVFSSFGNQKVKHKYGSVTSRVESIGLSGKGSNQRTVSWEHSLDFIKKNPLLGGGYGNWKIHSVPYQRSFQPWFINLTHVHNDFLEVTADTGILGGLFYAGMFACIFVYFFLLIKRPGNSSETLLRAGICIMAFCAYFVDSGLNFPLERTNIQVLSSLLFAIIVLDFIENKFKTKEDAVLNKNFALACILISAGTSYVSYQVLKSMQVQYKISADWLVSGRDPVKISSDEVSGSFPSIPNIGVSGMPIACMKAKYLYNDGKFQEAINVLNADNRSNPHLYYAEYLRSQIAAKINQPDSAYHYAKHAYYNSPSNVELYTYFQKMAFNRQDTAEMKRSFREITKYKVKPDVWENFAQSYYLITKNQNFREKVLDEGLIKFPKDQGLQYQKYFLEGRKYADAKSYALSIESFKKALSFRKDDKFAKLNLANNYYNQNEYRQAMIYYSDLINTQAFNDGNAEYFRGGMLH